MLKEVVRKWFARKADIVQTIDALVSNAELCKIALEKGFNLKPLKNKLHPLFFFQCTEDWDTVANCVEVYWNQKKSMVPHGTEPQVVGELLQYLHSSNLLYAGWLAGAGGGGFLYLITRNTNQFSTIKEILSANEVSCGCVKLMLLHLLFS